MRIQRRNPDGSLGAYVATPKEFEKIPLDKLLAEKEAEITFLRKQSLQTAADLQSFMEFYFSTLP